MVQNRNLVRITRQLPLVILLALMCAQNSLSEDLKEEPGNPRIGQNLFINKGCVRCHSIWEPARKIGPSLASVGTGRNLYDVCAAIWSHWPKMNAAMEPGKGKSSVLNPSEIRDVVAYLYYLNYYREPGNDAVGQEIFLDRGCSRCHALDPTSAEGKAGPAVYEMVDFQGPINLAVALWNHGGDMLQRMSQKRIPWPRFQGKEAADLVSYIRSQHEQVYTSPIQVPGNSMHGRDLFVSRACASCHEPTAGGSGIGPDLGSSEVPSSLSSLVAGLWNHYPKMAQVMSSKGISSTQMTTADMEDLMAYVYWIKAYGLVGDPAAGKRLYETKHCGTCHSKALEGSPLAPALIGSEITRSPYGMLAAIWNHGPKMQALLEQRNISWPTLTGDEMRNLVAFFRLPASRTSK